MNDIFNITHFGDGLDETRLWGSLSPVILDNVILSERPGVLTARRGSRPLVVWPDETPFERIQSYRTDTGLFSLVRHTETKKVFIFQYLFDGEVVDIWTQQSPFFLIQFSNHFVHTESMSLVWLDFPTEWHTTQAPIGLSDPQEFLSPKPILKRFSAVVQRLFDRTDSFIVLQMPNIPAGTQWTVVSTSPLINSGLYTVHSVGGQSVFAMGTPPSSLTTDVPVTVDLECVQNLYFFQSSVSDTPPDRWTGRAYLERAVPHRLAVQPCPDPGQNQLVVENHVIFSTASGHWRWCTDGFVRPYSVPQGVDAIPVGWPALYSRQEVIPPAHIVSYRSVLVRESDGREYVGAPSGACTWVTPTPRYRFQRSDEFNPFDMQDGQFTYSPSVSCLYVRGDVPLDADRSDMWLVIDGVDAVRISRLWHESYMNVWSVNLSDIIAHSPWVDTALQSVSYIHVGHGPAVGVSVCLPESVARDPGGWRVDLYRTPAVPNRRHNPAPQMAVSRTYYLCGRLTLDINPYVVPHVVVIDHTQESDLPDQAPLYTNSDLEGEVGALTPPPRYEHACLQGDTLWVGGCAETPLASVPVGLNWALNTPIEIVPGVSVHTRTFSKPNEWATASIHTVHNRLFVELPDSRLVQGTQCFVGVVSILVRGDIEASPVWVSRSVVAVPNESWSLVWFWDLDRRVFLTNGDVFDESGPFPIHITQPIGFWDQNENLFRFASWHNETDLIAAAQQTRSTPVTLAGRYGPLTAIYKARYRFLNCVYSVESDLSVVDSIEAGVGTSVSGVDTFPLLCVHREQFFEKDSILGNFQNSRLWFTIKPLYDPNGIEFDSVAPFGWHGSIVFKQDLLPVLKKNRLYYSLPAEPHTAPSFQFIDVGTRFNHVVFCGTLGGSVLVLTSEGVYRIDGVDQTVVTQLTNQPCLHGTLYHNHLFTWTPHGLHKVDPSGLYKIDSQIECLSRTFRQDVRESRIASGSDDHSVWWCTPEWGVVYEPDLSAFTTADRHTPPHQKMIAASGFFDTFRFLGESRMDVSAVRSDGLMSYVSETQYAILWFDWPLLVEGESGSRTIHLHTPVDIQSALADVPIVTLVNAPVWVSSRYARVVEAGPTLVRAELPEPLQQDLRSVLRVSMGAVADCTYYGTVNGTYVNIVNPRMKDTEVLSVLGQMWVCQGRRCGLPDGPHLFSYVPFSTSFRVESVRVSGSGRVRVLFGSLPRRLLCRVAGEWEGAACVDPSEPDRIVYPVRSQVVLYNTDFSTCVDSLGGLVDPEPHTLFELDVSALMADHHVVRLLRGVPTTVGLPAAGSPFGLIQFERISLRCLNDYSLSQATVVLSTDRHAGHRVILEAPRRVLDRLGANVWGDQWAPNPLASARPGGLQPSRLLTVRVPPECSQASWVQVVIKHDRACEPLQLVGVHILGTPIALPENV